MFRYEHVNSTTKFTIVAEIVSLLRKIYFRAVLQVKTLAVSFPLYPREMKTNTRNLNLPPFWRLFVSMEMVQPISTRALSRARGLSMRTHLTAVWLWNNQFPETKILGLHGACVAWFIWRLEIKSMWIRSAKAFNTHWKD